MSIRASTTGVFIDHMASYLRRIAEQLMQSGGDKNTLDHLANRLTQLMSCALHGEEMYHFQNITNHLIQAYNLVSSLLVESEIGNCGLCYSNNAGRPKFLISKETLTLFLEYNFSYKEIATSFNVSKRTIQRRVHEYQLYKEKYNHITDDELEELVHKILKLRYQGNERILASKWIKHSVGKDS